MHYRLIVRHAGVEGRGQTENLSERGAMASIDVDPALCAGDHIELDIELPGHGTVSVAASVRWTSTVLPGMTGLEFTQPISAELLGHIAELVTTGVDEAEGF
ncbi:PilZ domain protein [Enhygromyxa salina]|uniref:PilZ domain protein n=1 Tax=Enhygromyxa salina TaxID=215803 RepID=A0A2S9YB52_9BACT|nr:PilZ domain protein [Enhygromyxa salina]